ncbi:hypothetical protein A2773_04410 [Candidatus Gottesmanbacteria bacterium RIFCSPHIGHO2_01_FULL_39_10]|uniref:PIN domain-containing protein n=1 Tax=Candidatus Gottesmanbacteria bacterium RIFCSPHIGHO2_01_FULL_39_10 TaxID=1798375 RepID=A0A1F5ZRG8_9BACT|nr:MAG: hypothetical protein A2773_04410 [Candidatus Gottesmanbacteria bacterium RIFCSPHIGHO2_01_FULL_39_10]
MTKTIIVDANVIIRFLLNDHPRLSPIATSLFYKAQKKLINVYLDEVILAEVIWTLSSFYKIKKADLIENIEKFLSQDWVVSKKKDLMLKSLYIYKSSNLDYIDCWVYVVSQDFKFKLETFDRNLKRLT